MNANINASQPTSFGVNMWWTVPGLATALPTVQSLLIAHGFEKDDIEGPSDRVEVARAVRSFQNRRTKQTRRLAEIAQERGDSVVYGILDRESNGDQVGFVQATTVTYDKNANTVHVSGALCNEVQAALGEFKDKATDEDIRYFLRRVVRMCHGVSKRPTGGIYFVPAQFVGVIEQAQAFLKDLGVGAKLYVERVMDGQQEREIVREAVEIDIDKRLEDVMAGVERVERRVSALRHGEERVEELRGLMKVYQDLLGQEAKYEELTEKLDKAVQSIGEKMSKLQGDCIQPVLPMQPAGVAAVRVTGTRESLDDYEKAVKSVLQMSGQPMERSDIVAAVVASGYNGKSPDNIGGFFNHRADTGRLTRVSRGVYALAS